MNVDYELIADLDHLTSTQSVELIRNQPNSFRLVKTQDNLFEINQEFGWFCMSSRDLFWVINDLRNSDVATLAQWMF